MKALIIYISIHHGNTKKIGKAMADVLGGELVRPGEVNINKLSEYDLIGFGSGVYFGKHHRSLLNFVDELPVLKDKKVFIFSTSGMRNGILQFRSGGNFNRPVKEKMLGKGFDIIREFSCRGLNTYGPFKLIGGISKGRPNEKDLGNAINFATGLRDI